MLGLGWAATPVGLKAMEELKKLNHGSHIASADMCTFLIINISSLQLIPVNIIAYRMVLPRLLQFLAWGWWLQLYRRQPVLFFL